MIKNIVDSKLHVILLISQYWLLASLRNSAISPSVLVFIPFISKITNQEILCRICKLEEYLLLLKISHCWLIQLRVTYSSYGLKSISQINSNETHRQGEVSSANALLISKVGSNLKLEKLECVHHCRRSNRQRFLNEEEKREWTQIYCIIVQNRAGKTVRTLIVLNPYLKDS